MVVISYGKLREFFEIHADAKDALNNWYRLVLQADWSNLTRLKQCLIPWMQLEMTGLFLI